MLSQCHVLIHYSQLPLPRAGLSPQAEENSQLSSRINSGYRQCVHSAMFSVVKTTSSKDRIINSSRRDPNKLFKHQNYEARECCHSVFTVSCTSSTGRILSLAEVNFLPSSRIVIITDHYYVVIFTDPCFQST